MAATTPLPSPVVVEHRGAHGVAEPTRHGWEVELSAGTGRLDGAVATRLLHELRAAVAEHGGGTLRWRVPVPTPEHRRSGEAAGFDGRRRLVELRRPLPAPPADPPLATRSFVPGADDAEWLRVNNAAFSWHPEQSGWDAATLDAVLAEPWVDLDGFLLLPASPGGAPGDALAGFCWTKVHDEVDPALGEIFIIAVDPAHAGAGLGRRLVLTGLDHLSARGLATATLYTEVDNRPAMRLYEDLGFTVHHEVQVFTAEVGDAQTVTPTSDPTA